MQRGRVRTDGGLTFKLCSAHATEGNCYRRSNNTRIRTSTHIHVHNPHTTIERASRHDPRMLRRRQQQRRRRRGALALYAASSTSAKRSLTTMGTLPKRLHVPRGAHEGGQEEVEHQAHAAALRTTRSPSTSYMYQVVPVRPHHHPRHPPPPQAQLLDSALDALAPPLAGTPTSVALVAD